MIYPLQIELQDRILENKNLTSRLDFSPPKQTTLQTTVVQFDKKGNNIREDSRSEISFYFGANYFQKSFFQMA